MDDHQEFSDGLTGTPDRPAGKQDTAYVENTTRAGSVAIPFFEKFDNLSRPHRLLQLVALALRASHAATGLVSAEGDLQEHVTFGVREEYALEQRHSAWSGEVIRFIVQQARAIRVADFHQGLPERGVSRLLLAEPPLATGPLLGVPLCHGRSRGALYLARPPGQPPFSEQDLEMVVPICTWLEHGSFFEEARLLAQLRLLNRVAQTAAGSLDLSQILAVALRELDRHLPQYLCAVWLLEEHERTAPADAERTSGDGVEKTPGVLVLSACSLAANERAAKLNLSPGLRLPLEQTRFAACLRNGKAQYLELATPPREDGRTADGQRSPPDEAQSPFEIQLRQRGASSTFAVPLRAGEQAVGLLQSICTRATGFTNEQIQLLYLVADLLGPAISNCQLYRRLRAAYEQLRTTQNQLIQAEKMRALGELAGGMAHDFNNSLCGVLGFLELALANKGVAPAIASYLEMARTCTLDAAQTVRRVQDFARWQRHELSIQRLDFNELVRQTLELTRHKWENLTHARGAPIAVQVETEATEWVSGSPAELREVLTNLVFNAVDAMPQGGQLRVRTWNTASDLYLSVRDTGVGMNDSTRQRLFEPFFTTKGERGNGLGLSVTFGIIQRYGGEITVESEPGRGSTFLVRLPLKVGDKDGMDAAETAAAVGTKVEAARAPSSEDRTAIRSRRIAASLKEIPAVQERSRSSVSVEKACSSSSPASPQRPLRILVIEDEQSIRTFLTRALTRLGHHPQTTANAQEGLAAFSTERFDLVLTDLGLPGMSGEEVARIIARKSPATPVILLTGWSNQLKDEAQPVAGVAHILGKPVTLSTLSSAIAAVCRE